jgi:hypothetical protein
MPSSGLRGPFALTSTGIDNNVTYTSPGAYALGRTKDSKFLISYVGRSDDDVNARLHDHEGNYEQFKFEYCKSAKAAFEKECTLFHDFSPPDNDVHPARPRGTDWQCPRWDAFD